MRYVANKYKNSVHIPMLNDRNFVHRYFYSDLLYSALSNKYLKVMIHCLELMILNEKGDVLFVFYYRIKPQLSH